MKIAIPTTDNKLCAHFGHCEIFSLVDVDMDTKEILNIEQKAPEEGVSCQSASWLVDQGVNTVLAGGMGARPLNLLFESGIKVIPGCEELPIKDVVEQYLDGSLTLGENSCGGEHSHCHGEHSHCHGAHHQG